jgi:OOP family OmpA-OmpF porin
MKPRKYFYLIVGTIFFSLVLLQTAGAALRPSAWTLSPMAGAHFFSSDQLLEDAALYGLGIGYNFTERFATEAIISYAPTETASGVADDVDYTSLRLDLLYHFPLSGNFVPYVAFGAGEAFVSPDKIASDKNAVVGYGAGAKYFLNDALALRCDVRHLLDINDADAQRDHTVLNNFAVTAGLFLQFGGREVLPPPPLDTDGDNVIDALDHCPDTLFGVAVDEMGCPDSDGDGITDNLDLCPDTAAGVAVDGNGCAVVTDKDRDGVVDAQDACPDTPAKTVVDARGCPAQVAAVIDLPEPAMTFYLEYLPGESEVKNDFAAEMEKMADFIKANPGKRFVIEGHTDSVGSDTSNMRLSLLRAEKIKAYLSEKMGIPASLLEARGFGESNPVADNNTQEGRQQNRRVVIIAFPQL